MAAVGAANESELQAAAVALEPAAAAADARPLPTLDPRLLMAARRGDSKALKDLLQLNDDDQQVQGTRTDDGGSGTPTTAAAATTTTTTSVVAAPSISPPHVIVEVEPRRHDAVAALLPPPPASPVPVLEEDGVTTEEGSLLDHSQIVEQVVVVEPPPPHDDVAPPVHQPSAVAPAGSFPAAVPVFDEDGVITEEGSLLVRSEIVEQVVVEPPPPHDDVAPPARQPPAAAPAAGSFPAAVPVLDEDGVTMEGDSLLHVVAACGDTQDYLDCAKMIVRNKEKKGGAAAVRRALEARNRKGDMALHCAAGAGNAHMISCLVGLVTDDDEAGAAAVKKAFLRTQNECGETVLHQFIRAAAINHKLKPACIQQLMAMDPELACIPHEDGASPLYLAISLGVLCIARYLYVKSKGKLSYSGPDGRNVLHAAVYFDQELSKMILEWLKDTKPKEDISSVSLASQLTSQRDKKQKGSTPLHLAASLWWGCQIARLLLDANESTAYEADDEGSYPIHVAAWSGCLGIVKLLLERCPDCATLRDGKGRTFLHVAAEKECCNVVRYVCGEMPQQLSSMILNAQDSNGETALHGVVRSGNVDVFNCLLRNRQVCLGVPNQDGMTPFDLSQAMLPPGVWDYIINPRCIVWNSLFLAGAPNGGGRLELLTEKHMPKIDVDKESKNHTEATQLMSIVTALIATVTFTSAFTLPGGYQTDGEPALAGSYAFDAFILADTLAFICSITATCTLVYAGLPIIGDINIRNWYFSVSSALLQSAARSLVAAFGLGLYLVVHHTASAIAAIAIVFASSLYGNLEVWRLVRMATTVLARIGIRRYQVSLLIKDIFLQFLAHFWSYVIIFGLPAILKRFIHKKQL